MSLLAIARLFLYVRERPNNRGLRVEAIQHWAGGSFGDSWCVEMVWVWLDLWTGGNAPFPRGLNSQELRELATTAKWIVIDPRPGDIALSINAEGRAHHTALVTSAQPLATIAGNTSDDGTSVNGDRVAEHYIQPTGHVFVRPSYPTTLLIGE